MADSATAGSSSAPRCKRCSSAESTRLLRGDPVCDPCFVSFIDGKAIKRIEALRRETSSSRPAGAPLLQRYVLGLSLGASSTALLHSLAGKVAAQRAARRRGGFDLLAVHVDVDDWSDGGAGGGGRQEEAASPAAATTTAGAGHALFERCRRLYPHVSFLRVPVGTAVGMAAGRGWEELVPSSALPAAPSDAGARLRAFLSSPSSSASSRADLQRLLVRHLLLSVAAAGDGLGADGGKAGGAYDALLLGHTTTALAELALAETAKGRGVALPWMLNDGAVPVEVPRGDGSVDVDDAGVRGERLDEIAMPVYYPMREVFRKEVLTYSQIVGSSLTELILPDTSKDAPVVSLKYSTIEEVMSRYFVEVEENFPSVVANVVRTIGKLERMEAEERCAMCGTPLDLEGDERWSGELGEQALGATDTQTSVKICYGCQRSING